MTVLVQCIVCDETWEVRLRVLPDCDQLETVAARVAAEGGCPECGCAEATQI